MNEHNYQEKHMGTTANLTLICESEKLADSVAKETFSIINSYENKFSRFLPTSELSNLNEQKKMIASDEFITVLDKSIELTFKTQNGFNPLTQVSNLGYSKSFELIRDAKQIVANNSYNTNVEQITINRQTNEVEIQPNQKLDFGGILKGYLSQLLAEKIINENKEITGCIINIGGDLSTRGLDTIHKPFIFFLYNPISGAETPIKIKDRSLVTSGIYARNWQTNLGNKNHIVDADKQQNPDNDLISVSIIAENGAWAEAVCKLFLTKGTSVALKISPPEKNNYLYFVTYKNSKVQTNTV